MMNSAALAYENTACLYMFASENFYAEPLAMGFTSVS
jgi:hypothetical protein